MAADLHIHAMGVPGTANAITEDALACFFKSTLSSKYFKFHGTNWCSSSGKMMYECPHRECVTGSDGVWVGEVSWLKAMIFGDVDTFVPEPVEQVAAIIGEDLPVLDDELLEKILEALEVPRKRAAGYDTTSSFEVVTWLRDHMGQRLFTVSW